MVGWVLGDSVFTVLRVGLVLGSGCRVSSVLLWVSCAVLLFAVVWCAVVCSSAMAADCGVLLLVPYGMRTFVERFGVFLGGTGGFLLGCVWAV